MNKYEKRAQAERKAVVRSSMTLGGAGLALLIVVVLILWMNSSAPTGYFSKVVIGVAILLLVSRLVSRRWRSGPPKAAQPDPKSVLKLD
jgi:formate-dependent nitrite reductase membrane component NrfD